MAKNARNIICNILYRDNNDKKYRKIFSIEGEKTVNDLSVYVIYYFDRNIDPMKEHFSYHARENDDRKVRVHLAPHRGCFRMEPPLEKRFKPAFIVEPLGSGIKCAPKAPKSKEDIVLDSDINKLFKCSFIFHSNMMGLFYYLKSKGDKTLDALIEDHEIPTKYISNFHISVTEAKSV